MSSLCNNILGYITFFCILRIFIQFTNYIKTIMEEEPFVPKPDSHLALAIITTVLCCLPLGIVAIIKATKVDSLYMMKQYALAQQASDDAKKWSIIGIIISAVGMFLYIIFIVLAAVIAANQ